VCPFNDFSPYVFHVEKSKTSYNSEWMEYHGRERKSPDSG
jgi:hypothetical protein